MKQLIIGLVLAVLLVGCSEKPKFSINEGDTLETYANNPIFTEMEVFENKGTNTSKVNETGYLFTTAPASMYGIKTSDLDVLGGTIMMTNKRLNTALTIKGKESFSKLDNRLSKLKDFRCVRAGFGEGRMSQCLSSQGDGNELFGVFYNQFSDIVTLTHMKY